MSLSIQQIVVDAKNLAAKLKESNSTADNLLSRAQSVGRQIDGMKQYSDDIGELNTTASHCPRAALVAGIQQENRHLRELQTENRQLKAALEEQSNALELIMSKYRQQMTKLTAVSRVDFAQMRERQLNETILEQALKINEMAQVMSQAAHIDDNLTRTQEELSRLSTENKGLRQILQIAAENGSVAETTKS